MKITVSLSASTKEEAILKEIAKAFTMSRMKFEDLEHIEYKKTKSKVIMQDIGHAFGHMYVIISKQDSKYTPDEIADLLIKYGASKIKPQKRRY